MSVSGAWLVSKPYASSLVSDNAAYEGWLTTQLLRDPAIARVDSPITMKVIKREG